MANQFTRPSAEDLRFNSNATGEHILDLYLEACELGGKPLPELLAALFSELGELDGDNFEFRVNEATRTMQFRFGVFIDPEAGWRNVAGGALLRHRGEWISNEPYEQTDLVTHNNNIYLCLVRHAQPLFEPVRWAKLIDFAHLEVLRQEVEANAANVATAAAQVATSLPQVLTARDEAVAARNEAVPAAAQATAAAAAALVSQNAARASELDAEDAATRAENAAIVVAGGMVDGGPVSLASGVYPPPKQSGGQPISTIWRVTVGGTVSGVVYKAGDTLVYSVALTDYYKIDSTDEVASVNGKTGIVVLNATDVNALPITGGVLLGPVGFNDGSQIEPMVDTSAGVNYGIKMVGSEEAMITAAADIGLCSNITEYDGALSKVDVSKPSAIIFVNGNYGIRLYMSDAGATSPFQHSLPIYHEGDPQPLNPNTIFNLTGGTISSQDAGAFGKGLVMAGNEYATISGSKEASMMINVRRSGGSFLKTDVSKAAYMLAVTLAGAVLTYWAPGSVTPVNYNLYHEGNPQTQFNTRILFNSDGLLGSLAPGAGGGAGVYLEAAQALVFGSRNGSSTGYNVKWTTGTAAKAYSGEVSYIFEVNASGLTLRHSPAGNASPTVNSWQVFHEGNPPTPAQVGAISANDGQISWRNRIINGNMRFAQRGPSGSANATSTYQVDRWTQTNNGTAASVNVTQISDAPSGQYNSLRYTVATADTAMTTNKYYCVEQRIEGNYLHGLFFNPFSLSFWVRSPKAGIHCVALCNASGAVSYVREYTITNANSWEYKTINNIPGPLTSGYGTWNTTINTGLIVRFTMAAGPSVQGAANAWTPSTLLATANQVNCLDTVGNIFAITNVQLEGGTQATPYENRPYNTELELCQRYYYGVPVGAEAYLGMWYAANTKWIFTPMPLPVQMRISTATAALSNVNILGVTTTATGFTAITNSAGLTWWPASSTANGVADGVVKGVMLPGFGLSAEL